MTVQCLSLLIFQKVLRFLHPRDSWSGNRNRPPVVSAERNSYGITNVNIDDLQSVSYTHLTLPTNREV